MAFGETDLNLDENNDRPGLDATIVAGWGRFINATALRKAVRIEDFLLEEGVISERLPKESMIDSGHIIEKEAEYRHNRLALDTGSNRERTDQRALLSTATYQ